MKLPLFPILGISGTIISIFIFWKIYEGTYFAQTDKAVTIKCHYMSYACGDCYPNWQIDSDYAKQNGFRDLIDKDFNVSYKEKMFEESFTDDVSRCVICYDFYFTGKMEKTLSGKLRFGAVRYRTKLRPNCCD